MSEILDRGARVLNEWQALDTHDDCRRAFAAALRAGLDPGNEELVERVGFELANDVTGNYSVEQAKRIIAALRAHCGEGE